MKPIILFLLITTLSFANVKAIVSITPEVSILKAIGGDRVNIEVMVPKGASPHTFSPKPKQMIKLSFAQIYFGIGVEFEKAWLKRFTSQNKNLKVIDLSSEIKKINNNDHIWLSIKNLKIMAEKVYETLALYDKENRNYYEKNYKNYLDLLQKCEDNIKEILKRKKSKVFMTFHPAFTYLAKEFGLKQIAIEVEGKEPSMREILKIIKSAKKNHISSIITSPEFSDKSAKIIAKELNATVIKLSPLDENICHTIKEVALSLK